LQLNHSGPYSSFISKEYPKFLTENLSIAHTDLEKLKMQEQNLQEYNRRIADFEKRRLHAETEAFDRQIHETRLNGKIYQIFLYFFSLSQYCHNLDNLVKL